MTPMDAMAYSGKRRPTREWYFRGLPPLDLPKADEIHISCTFTWDKSEAEDLFNAWSQYYPVVRIGGGAYGNIPHNFQPGMYLKQGVTFTTRGCNHQCPWCLVQKREGKLFEFNGFPAGNIVQDNNLLQASSSHLDKVFSMLSKQRGIIFSGGIEARLVTDEIADRFRSVSTKTIFLAADTEQSLTPLRKAVKTLGLGRNKTQCYVLIGFNGETMVHAENRLREVFNAGALPYAMLYQPPTDKKLIWPIEWRRFARLWQRPAIIKAMMKSEFKGE
jgi:hypothetical protein